MKVVSFKICPFVQRVTALLEAKGADYEIEYIDLGNKPQWFLEVSPNRQVPILMRDDGRVLFESDAIVEYLDETIGTPTLSADPADRAQDRAWSYLGSKHYLVQCSSQRSSDAETLAERRGKLAKAFSNISGRVAQTNGPFAHGDHMGAIDIAWLPILHRAAVIEEWSGVNYFEDHPTLEAWQAAVMGTGIPDKSVPEDFIERFTGFYLAETTYLGQLAREKIGEACCGDPQCTVEDLACCA
ncbi:MAG: glutathione S-transferase family protein [Pseudomonadota bacterium]